MSAPLRNRYTEPVGVEHPVVQDGRATTWPPTACTARAGAAEAAEVLDRLARSNAPSGGAPWS